MSYNQKKTAHLACFFINLHGGKINYMKLIKLLYLLDRAALGKYGFAPTGDTYFSMKHGPILSNVLDNIHNGKNEDGLDPFWSKMISTPIDYQVSCLNPKVPLNALSPIEIEMANEIFNQFGNSEEWQLVDHLHKVLPEWEQQDSGSELIQKQRILEVLNKPGREIELILNSEKTQNFIFENLEDNNGTGVDPLF